MELQKRPAVKTPLSDEQIIALYFARDERAIEETDFKYKKYLFSVAYNVLYDPACCEECVNDTYLGAWNEIPPTRPRVFKAFLAVIARRCALKRYRSANQVGAIPSEMTLSLSELEGVVTDGEDTERAFDARELGRVLSDFVRALPERKQFIFIGRYYMAQPIDKIAKDLSRSRSSVNKELAAIRAALKEKLESEGYTI